MAGEAGSAGPSSSIYLTLRPVQRHVIAPAHDEAGHLRPFHYIAPMQQLLMIEDDARLAQMVGEYLERSGFGVTHALDAKAGMAVLQDPPAGAMPDLVMLDLMLPDIDGLE